MEEPLVKDPVAIFLTIITIVLVAPLIMEKLRLPGLVGIIVGGMIVGPHGLHLLSIDPAVELLATVGLIYLMFNVGLEIDLPQFRRVRNRAMVFGLLAFLLPLGMGMLLARVNGLAWSGSILVGSLIASQALINYPILSRMGIMQNEAVSVSIGATLFTDIAALLLLAVVVRIHEGSFSAAGLFLQTILIISYIVIVLLALPRIGNFFFRRFTERSVEFQFVLFSLFVVALLAELIHLHAIIGAFLAGLAINSTLPSRSSVVNRILFVGESFFIPIFLLYVGMIIDPWAIFGGTRTIYLGISLLVSLLAMKLLAAFLAAILFHYDHDELMTMWGISHAEASAALAILLVGSEAGLLNQNVFNGGVLLVLITCISSPLIVQHFGSRLKPSPSRTPEGSMYERILVCVANPKTQERLIELAGILSRTVQGELLPLHITLDQDSKPPDVLKEGTDALESDMLDDPETTIKRVTRIDASLHEGILHAATENQASIIFMGGLGKSRLRDAIFGSVVDQVVIKAHVPVLVGYLTSPMNAMKRVVLLALPRSAGLRSPAKAFEPALIISEALNLPVLVLTDSRHFHDVNEYIQSLNSDRIEGIHLLDHTTTRDILKITKSQDLLIYPLAGTVMRIRSSTGRLPKKLSDSLQVSLASIVYPVPPAEYRNAGSPYLRDWV